MTRKLNSEFRVEQKIRAELRKILWKKGGPNICFYCAGPVYRHSRTLDHMIPKTHGGTWHISNIVLACIECNRAKADLTVLEFHRLCVEHGGIERVKELFGNGSHARLLLSSGEIINRAAIKDSELLDKVHAVSVQDVAENK